VPLAIHRKEGDAVVIVTPEGHVIRVICVKVERPAKGTLLAFDAPKSCRIWREELLKDAKDE
jgi:sRNA-binding carbon storage regulator CsrA